VKLLIVDDDADLRAILGFALRDAGFVVVEAAGAAAALELVEAELPDLVVLDLNLGRDDGLELLPRLRTRDGSPRPILVLSVRAAEEDVVHALDLGADDYLTKPFSPRTLLARVRALLRRAGGSAPDLLVAGDLRLDLERRMLQAGARSAVRLTPLEARLVQFLIARAGKTVPSERLLVHIWGGRGEGDRQLLKQLVHRLRQKIEPEPTAPRYVITDAREGYRLETRDGEMDPSG
jgi:DNA-binding response OmpR family regulator